MEKKFWVSKYNSDAFSGLEVVGDLREAVEKIKEKTTEVIDVIFDKYSEYRDYEVECAAQARHGSYGTKKITTLEELEECFEYVDDIENILAKDVLLNCELEEINGNEIIKFLNEKIDEELYDTSVCGPIEFESQEIKDGLYYLYFSVKFKNWDEYETISDNYLIIDKYKIDVWLGERFDGDGSGEVLSNVLSEWIKTHEFKPNSNETFISMMREVYEELPQISFNDINGMDKIIKKLVEIKTYMK